MKFGPASPREAVGGVTVHTLRHGPLLLKKGTTIGAAEVASLEKAGVKEVVVVRLEPERIEVCVEVPARAVGADQHQGADRIPRGLLHLGNGELDACRLRPRLDLVAERALQRLAWVRD